MRVMEVRTGVDIVSIQRVEELWRLHGRRFLERVYTPAELDYCLAPRAAAVRLAGRFAAKEALLKVLGTGWARGVHWTDVEVLRDSAARPVITLHGEAHAIARRLRIGSLDVSISHADGYAVASAVALLEMGD